MDTESAKNTEAVEFDIPEPSDPKNGTVTVWHKARPSSVPVPRQGRYSAPQPSVSASGSRPTQNTQRPDNAGNSHSYAAADTHGTHNDCFSYSPKSGLIDKVTVYNWHTDYSYYEQFRKTALRLRDYEAEPCEHIPFFSYMPQYSQMNGDQLRFYLYLRGEICEDRFPEADYTYLLLLLYETINLSDVNPPEYTMRIFCNVLRGYAKTHERLIMQLADWICDFSLISGTFPEREKIDGFLNEMNNACYLKEFYIGLGRDRVSSSDILRYTAGYNYTKSRYATGKNREFYDRHISGVLDKIINAGEGAEIVSTAMLEKFSMVRDSYVGALCSPAVKKRLEISYFSFSKSHELRFLITDILKYTENQLRQSLGIRSRLSHGELPANIKKLADGYFAENLTGIGRHYGEPEPLYEQLYEPAPSKLTPEAAMQIEEKSWQTTERLLEAFGGTDFEDESDEKIPAPVHGLSRPENNETASEINNFSDAVESAGAAENSCEKSGGLASVFSDGERAFVRAALDGDREKEKSIAKQAGLSVPLMADAVNAKAADEFGDIILEEKDGVWTVLEDYTEEITDMNL